MPGELQVEKQESLSQALIPFFFFLRLETASGHVAAHLAYSLSSLGDLGKWKSLSWLYLSYKFVSLGGISQPLVSFVNVNQPIRYPHGKETKVLKLKYEALWRRCLLTCEFGPELPPDRPIPSATHPLST